LNAESNFLRDFVISRSIGLRQSRTFHTLANGPKSGVQLSSALGRIPDSERDENDKAVWHAPEYYQAAHAAEQMIQSAVQIIGLCRHVQAGMSGLPDYASLNDIQGDLVDNLRKMISLTIEGLYDFEVDNLYGEDEGREYVVRYRRNVAFLKALGKALKTDLTLSRWMTGGSALPPEA
jgi:hypothetical protein